MPLQTTRQKLAVGIPLLLGAGLIVGAFFFEAEDEKALKKAHTGYAPVTKPKEEKTEKMFEPTKLTAFMPEEGQGTLFPEEKPIPHIPEQLVRNIDYILSLKGWRRTATEKKTLGGKGETVGLSFGKETQSISVRAEEDGFYVEKYDRESNVSNEFKNLTYEQTFDKVVEIA